MIAVGAVSDSDIEHCPSEMFDLMHALHEMAEHEPDYRAAVSYYEGTAPEFFASARLRRRLQAGSKHFRVNLAKTPVDVIVDSLSIASVSVIDNPSASTLLNQILTDNEMEEEIPNLLKRTCEYGDGYLIVWPGDDPDDPKVEMFFNDALTCRAIYDEEDPRLVRFVIKRFVTNDKRVRANLLYADRIEKYICSVGGNEKRWSDWSRYLDDDMDDDAVEGAGAWPIPNPYGEVPVFHFRTDRPYGVPLHKDAYGPQDGVNKLIVTLMSTVDYSGYPQRYALTDAGVEDDEETDFNSNWLGDDAQATRHTTDTSTLKSGPGELWYMHGTKSVGQFSVADPKAFLDPLEVLVRLMAQTTTTPLHYFDPSGDRPSGESLRVANKPKDDKVKHLHRGLGATMKKALAFALKVAGIENAVIDLQWDNPSKTDDSDGWATTSAKIAAGVPVRQALMEAGYGVEQLDEWRIPLLGSEADMTMEMRAKALLDIGSAAQGLAAAVDSGVVDPVQIKALIARFVSEDVPALAENAG